MYIKKQDVLEIIEQARNGDIDNDLRSIKYKIECIEDDKLTVFLSDLRLQIKNIPTTKKEDRHVRGAYVDCLNRLNRILEE